MKKLFRLFNLLSLNYFLKHRLKIFFAVIGMSTGIAIYITTSIYSDTIYNDVKQKEKLLQQSEKWVIKSINGRVSEEIIPDILSLNIFYNIYPKSERFEYLIDNNRKSLLVRVIGLDSLRFVKQQGGLVQNQTGSGGVPRFLASNYFDKDDTLTFKKSDIREKVEIKNFIPGSSKDSPILITDIAAYQELFSDYNWIDELEVTLLNDLDRDEILILLKNIDPELTIIKHEGNVKNKQSLSDAFLVNLKFFSLIALIISVLLIYQFYRFILIERETEFSKLRAVGMSNGDIFFLLMLELTIIGVLSALAGLAGGVAVSVVSLEFILKTVNTFYYNVGAQSIFVGSKILIVSLIVSLSGCYLAGLHPVIRFLRKTDPERSINMNFTNKDSGKKYLILFVTGLILLGGLFFLLLIDLDLSAEKISAFSLILFSLGSLLILPFCLSNLSKFILLLIPGIDFKFKTAISYIKLTLVRQCFYILSLGILIGFVISLVIFISSFRQTINNWIIQVTPADMYIQSSFNTIQQPYPISDELFEYLSNHPDVIKYDYISRYMYSYNNIPLQIRASKLDILKSQQRLKFKSLEKPISQLDESWVFVSEPFQKKYGKGSGDILKIIGTRKSETVKIMGVFHDYVTEKGAILIDTKLAEKLFLENKIHGLTIYNLDSPAQLKLENDLRNEFSGENLEIQSKKDLREGTLRTFDKTFNIVWFLAVLASVISVVTIINSSSMVFLERLFEFTQLRAIGASSSQIFSFLSSQMILLTVFSLITAYYCSVIFIFIIDKINWEFFGWSINIVFDWRPYLVSMILLFLLTYLTIRVPFNKSLEGMKFYSLRNE